MFPPDKVQSVVDCKPARCGHCDGRLRDDDPAPQRHQVAQLPKIEPEVTEYRLHTLGCERCGHCTRSELPAGTPTGSFGATVVATITLLLGVYGLSRRDTADLMRDMFGLPISVGAVVGCQRIGAAALAQPHVQRWHRPHEQCRRESAAARRHPSQNVLRFPVRTRLCDSSNAC